MVRTWDCRCSMGGNAVFPTPSAQCAYGHETTGSVLVDSLGLPLDIVRRLMTFLHVDDLMLCNSSGWEAGILSNNYAPTSP